ncbi:uncharacterized protein CANTADRAFT_46698 [Suhomyces tanzawaensis NRRL Y-17324]|uniref:RRM domain-containing protein n=1 Tax=Suhomyces tanzawaensis NRRL Y-17324 TaxID=984487 RepID=A0A1E4SN57_9ASCO|nr:uncharacterized protein CANTADRAFT_46698 [Suhomyces tanzawaensis NRRL Y-17324]ODV80857.1 hypothetical protein CANTADRAFT_46698 [Suhomyces tanzawaensis NRRL Y-17324]
MNAIRKLNQINQKELEQNTSYESSWHYDYRDTAYIYIGGLPYNIAEKDILTIFSQYGIPSHINLVKDRETGKSRGFCYLKYFNFKSCVLAVDNLNGLKIFDRSIKVDHVYFKLRGNEKEEDYLVDYSEFERRALKNTEDVKKPQKLLELKDVQDDDELRDPMENYNASEPALAVADSQKHEMDDELKDPMEAFLSNSKKDDKKRHEGDRHRHRHHDKDAKKHRSHRHSHKHGHKDSHKHSNNGDDREKSRELKRRSDGRHSGNEDASDRENRRERSPTR